MQTAVFCLESVIGPMTAPLAALAQRPGIVALVWEMAGHRLRVRFDEACLDADTLRDWVQAAGYAISLVTVTAQEAGRPLISAGQGHSGTMTSIPWLELPSDE